MPRKPRFAVLGVPQHLIKRADSVCAYRVLDEPRRRRVVPGLVYLGHILAHPGFP